MSFYSYSSTSSMNYSIEIYSDKLIKLLSCEKGDICFDNLIYRGKQDDFVLTITSTVNSKYDPSQLKVLVNALDSIILELHGLLVSDDATVSNLSGLFESNSPEIDNLIRNNLNVVYVLHFIDSYFFVVSTANGLRHFEHEIQTKIELNNSVERVLNAKT